MNLIWVNGKEKLRSFLDRNSSSIEFYRLIAYLAKRVISTLNLFGKLPTPFPTINVVLHLVRAILSIALFWKVKNKNLGECIKLFFALAKVIISSLVLFFSLIVAVLWLLERIFPLSRLSVFKNYILSWLPSLNIYFFYYSLAKTIYSVLLLLVNFVCLFRYQDNQNQYVQNLVKHSNILTTALPMTLLMGLIINGSLIVMYFSSVLMALLFVGYLVRLGYLVYQYFRLGSDEESMTLKQYYWEHIKNTLYNLCILVFSVAVVILSLYFPLTIVMFGASIKIIPIMGLVVLTVWDVIQSCRFFSPKSNDESKAEPLGIFCDPNTPIRPSGYYGQENIAQYLKVPDLNISDLRVPESERANLTKSDLINKKIAEATKELLDNEEILFKKYFLQITQLQNRLNKIQSFSKLKRALYALEEKALKVKIKVLTNNIAVLLKDTLPNLSTIKEIEKRSEEIEESKPQDNEEIKKACFIDLILKTNIDHKPTKGLKKERKIECEQKQEEEIEIENDALQQNWKYEKQYETQAYIFLNVLLDSPEEDLLRADQRLKHNLFLMIWNLYISKEATESMQSPLLNWSFFKKNAKSADVDKGREIFYPIYEETRSGIDQLNAEKSESAESADVNKGREIFNPIYKETRSGTDQCTAEKSENAESTNADKGREIFYPFFKETCFEIAQRNTENSENLERSERITSRKCA